MSSRFYLIGPQDYKEYPDIPEEYLYEVGGHSIVIGADEGEEGPCWH